MKKALYRLQTYYNQQATDVEKSVLRYILDNTRKVVSMDIHTLAKEGYCSAATIVRICKKNGFKGFKSLKLALMNDLKFTDEIVEANFSKESQGDIKNQVKNILDDNIRSIYNTYNLIDFEELIKIINLMDKARVIRLYGIGASYLVARDLQQKLQRIGKFTELYEDIHMSLISSSNISEGDLAFVFSYSGATKEILEMAQNIKEKGGTIVAVTKYNNSKLAQVSQYKMFVPQIESSLRIGASASRISQLCAVDVLFNLYVSEFKSQAMDKIINTKEMLPKEEE